MFFRQTEVLFDQVNTESFSTRSLQMHNPKDVNTYLIFSMATVRHTLIVQEGSEGESPSACQPSIVWCFLMSSGGEAFCRIALTTCSENQPTGVIVFFSSRTYRIFHADHYLMDMVFNVSLWTPLPGFLTSSILTVTSSSASYQYELPVGSYWNCQWELEDQRFRAIVHSCKTMGLAW